MDSAKTSLLWVKPAAVTLAQTVLCHRARTSYQYLNCVCVYECVYVCLCGCAGFLLMSSFCFQCKHFRDAADLNEHSRCTVTTSLDLTHDVANDQWECIMGDTDTDCWWYKSVFVFFVVFFFISHRFASGALLTACPRAPQLIEITIAGAAVSW